MSGEVRVGTAGWSIPRALADIFPVGGTHLERYAQRFQSVEINSSFYRPHRPATYARWAASVPQGFRFAVKLPREISHHLKLRDADAPLERFLCEIRALDDKLGPVLVQLPPRLHYDAQVAPKFFADFRERFAGSVVCEPRHPTWFSATADAMLADFQVARVLAGPPVVQCATAPGGWQGMVYRRLHRNPDVYYSRYSTDAIDSVAAAIRKAA